MLKIIASIYKRDPQKSLHKRYKLSIIENKKIKITKYTSSHFLNNSVILGERFWIDNSISTIVTANIIPNNVAWICKIVGKNSLSQQVIGYKNKIEITPDIISKGT